MSTNKIYVVCSEFSCILFRSFNLQLKMEFDFNEKLDTYSIDKNT